MKSVYLIIRLLAMCSIVACLTTGCAIPQARKTYRYRNAPHYFPSTKLALNGEYLHGDPICMACIWFCTFPIELPICVVSDVVLMPLDYMNVGDSTKSVLFVSNALYSEATPSATTFMKYYHARACESDIRSSVRHYLSLPPEQINPEKIRMLLQTGAFNSIFAEGPFIDKQVINAMLEATREDRNMQFLFALAENPHLPDAGFKVLIERAAASKHHKGGILCSLLRNSVRIRSNVRTGL